MHDEILTEFTRWFINEFDELPDLNKADDKEMFDVFLAGFMAGLKQR